MNLRLRLAASAGVVLLALLLCARVAGAETFRVATYNVENYLDEATADPLRQVRRGQSQSPREHPAPSSPTCSPCEEMGSTNALLELRDSLKADGLDLPYWEHVTGFDTNIHVAILSRFPFTARRPHTNDSFLLERTPLPRQPRLCARWISR